MVIKQMIENRARILHHRHLNLKEWHYQKKVAHIYSNLFILPQLTLKLCNLIRLIKEPLLAVLLHTIKYQRNSMHFRYQAALIYHTFQLISNFLAVKRLFIKCFLTNLKLNRQRTVEVACRNSFLISARLYYNSKPPVIICLGNGIHGAITIKPAFISLIKI